MGCSSPLKDGGVKDNPLGVKLAPVPELNLREAVLVKSAELWLKLGQPTEALLELQQLPLLCRSHPWALKVMQKAFRMATKHVHFLV